jgi:SAM-dependent methyltransferase
LKEFTWYWTLRSTLKGSPTRSRLESNKWLRTNCRDITGKVLSIGSGNDSDLQGGFYRDYFPNALSYTTSEVNDEYGSDLVLDVRSMAQISDSNYDCIYCSGVLEHVDDYHSGLAEMTRILKPGGVFLVGLPFRQAPHLVPHDYWRFTEYGIRYILSNSFDILDLIAIDVDKKGMAAAHWVKSRKKH